jgi:hypothetical protein
MEELGRSDRYAKELSKITRSLDWATLSGGDQSVGK